VRNNGSLAFGDAGTYSNTLKTRSLSDHSVGQGQWWSRALDGGARLTQVFNRMVLKTGAANWYAPSRATRRVKVGSSSVDRERIIH
jgi:hypothetical protein